MAGWVKVNIDGAFKCNPGLAGCGGVIRNSIGGWSVVLCAILTYAVPSQQNCGEQWVGLKLAWSIGFKKLIVESYSRVLVDLLYLNLENEYFLKGSVFFPLMRGALIC